MHVELQARHFELSDPMRDYVDRKIGRFDRYLQGMKAIRVELAHGLRRSAGEVYTAQITLWVDNAILRAEEMDHDLFAAVDKAADKLQRQMERFKGKRLDRWHDHTAAVAEMSVEAVAAEEAEAEGASVVRRKRFAMFPMGEQEAIEQLNLLGHDFYLFMNADSGHVNVVYRRKNGQYGLIEPELA